MDKETLYMMALTRVPKLNHGQQRRLLETLGSATAVYENRHDILDAVPDSIPALRDNLAFMDTCLPRCEEEMNWAEKNHVECIGFLDSRYPARMKECDDAPMMLYYRGTADLNCKRILSMVGTRKITDYGRQVCDVFLRELAGLCPDILIMSGLAYGVDIQCHRQAMQNGMETIGVLAHGMDRIYPVLHRNTAREMLEHGGLLTEFMSRTPIEKRFFLQRNRIVAGCADATIVVESAAKGGSLITAEIAQSYGREVFAFPGRMTDRQSEGCNRLIANNTAGLVNNAGDFVKAMGWQDDMARKKQLREGVQQELFPALSPEENLVVNALRDKDRLQLNLISVATGIPAGALSGLLFTMEMKGIVRMIPGGMYRLN
ncbi:MAG: DNA-processing protein DprA [Paraprevotella sp.]|nr:DNA-processing protein DprA [Paraprevotella sp.]